MTDQVETPAPKPEGELVGLGGWLILWCISLVVGPLTSIGMLFVGFDIYSDVAASGYGGIYTMELAVEIGILILTIYAAILFFGKKSNAPKVIIILLIANAGASAVLMLIEMGVGARPFYLESLKHFILGGVAAAIWIPYFNRSRRVQATFVN